MLICMNCKFKEGEKKGGFSNEFKEHDWIPPVVPKDIHGKEFFEQDLEFRCKNCLIKYSPNWGGEFITNLDGS